jgi:hypothetical protein
MLSNPTAQQLYEYALTLPVIDAHEHFISESEHVKQYLSFFDYLGYSKHDLASAGAGGDVFAPQPVNEEEAIALFARIKPYWAYIKTGSYSRPALLAIKKFHGCDDFTEESIIKIGRELNASNKPGLYDEIFNLCKIEKILNQNVLNDEKAFADKRFCYGILHEGDYGKRLNDFFTATPKGSYNNFLDSFKTEMEEEHKRGAVLQKFFPDIFICPPDEKEAHTEFENMRLSHLTTGNNTQPAPVLSATIARERIKQCAEQGIVVAIHTGVWGNVPRLSPTHLFSLFESHWGTGVTFDVYHMGIPYVRECAYLGKNYPFVNLNLCWAHNVSEQMTRHAINEYLDIVPVNKIFGFGGDICTLPQHVWGQLHHALENLSEAFAHRISIGRMDMDYAKMVMRLWLYNNPKRVYKL